MKSHRDLYILRGREIVPCSDVLSWADWYERADRKVACAHFRDGSRVSTVFLGLDHNFTGKGPPILFETKVFGGALDDETTRASTWEEAARQHAEMYMRVERALHGRIN
jgi:hypothetical protein